MRAAVVLVLATLLVATQAATFYFVGNVSLTSDEQTTLKGRETTTGGVNVLGYYRRWYQSASLDATNGSLNGDLIFGEMWAGAGNLPVAYLTYFNASASIDPNNASTIDFAGSAAFIGSAYLALEEVDPSGNVVEHLDFTGALLNLGNLYWQQTEVSSNDGLSWMTITGSETDRNYSISITYLISSKVGIINKANTPITPRVVESIVEIDNWPYQSSSNSLKLIVAVASAAGSIDGTGKTLSLGSGITKVFASVAGTADVSTGNGVAVSVSGSVTTDLSSVSSKAQDLATAVQTKYGSNAQIALFNITFPAGSEKITYDPTIGQGEPLSPQTAPASGAASFAVATALLALLLLLALFF